jgi:hypothetical protein
LESAAAHAPRPYRFVILSDHGQSGGATFKQRYHLTLEELVQKLATEKYQVGSSVDTHEDWKHVNVLLTETIQSNSAAVRRPMKQMLRNRTQDGRVDLGPEAVEAPGQAAHEESDVVVLASGNLGVIYSTRRDTRATLEEIEALYPGLLDRLAEHEGIGFVLVHSQTHGPVVIGPEGWSYLGEGRVEGTDPLASFGPNAAKHLLRTDSFPDAPDILINSFYNAEANEVAAFEELIGSHGGLGGWQTQPFVLHPAVWEMEREEILGAEELYKVLKGWVSETAQGQA